MILRNVTITGAGHTGDIRVLGEKIVAPSSNATKNELDLTFEPSLAFPGLINSHDHLDFNSFPLLGNRIYNNYTEWGADIHLTNKDIINAVLKIPQALRTQWGIYKNLLNGVTTVINHGKRLNTTDDLIDIYQGSNSLHSVKGEKNWKYRLNFYAGKKPVAIHIGEGTDGLAAEEIDSLIKWNLFRKTMIGIHGVAMTAKQAASFSALIWCPDSNYFLLDRTAAIDRLKNTTPILFGTDSTLTAHWNLWTHLRLAREQEMVTDTELFDMLTTTPASIWGLKDRGSIKEGQQADIVIARPPGGSRGWDAFYTLDPENIQLVLRKGNIKLFSGDLYDQLARSGFDLQDFHKIYINGQGKYILGNLPDLMTGIRKYYPSVDFPITIS